MQTKVQYYETLWFLWLTIILIPPIGIIILWNQKRFTKLKNILFSILIVILWFISLAIFVPSSQSTPIFKNHDEFVTRLNESIKELESDFNLEQIEETKNLIISELTDDITIIENLDTDGYIREIILVGKGNGADIILALGLLVDTANQFEDKKQIGEIMKELKLFDEGYQYENNEIEVVQELLTYNLKYADDTGVIFSISK